MKHIGIIGSNGFIGTHLYQSLRMRGQVILHTANRQETESPEALADFAAQSDVIIDCAGESRSADCEALYQHNCRLAEQIVGALRAAESPKHLLFVTTTHVRQTPYHLSKEENCRLFLQWVQECGGHFTALKTPNLFGPYSRPFFNSVVSTFCYQAVHGQQPAQINDVTLELVHIRRFVQQTLPLLDMENPPEEFVFPVEYRLSLPQLWEMVRRLKAAEPVNRLERLLKETMESYLG